MKTKLLLLTFMIFTSNISYSQKIDYPTIFNSKLCMSDSSNVCELSFCSEKSDYNYGEPIHLTVKVKNTSKSSYMVEDPDLYLPDSVYYGAVDEQVWLSIGDDDPAHFGNTLRKLKLDPGDSAFYEYNIYYDATTIEDDYELCNVKLSFSAYPYYDRWAHVVNCPDSFASVAAHSIWPAFEIYLRSIYIVIHKDISKIKFYNE